MQSAFMGRPERELRAGQANIGGYRMTEAAAEASELASVSVARTGDALAGVLACLADRVLLDALHYRAARMGRPVSPGQAAPPRVGRGGQTAG